MKTFTLTLAALLFTLGSHATVITVDNNPNSPADYTDLQTAANNASSGDTLYIHGSNTTYGNVDIDRQLTLIGTGYDPQNQWLLKSEVGFITFQDGIGAQSADGTNIIGLEIINDISDSYGTQSIKVARCYLYGDLTLNPNTAGDSWLIENNVISNTIYIYGGTNITIRNNLMVLNAAIWESHNSSVLVTNNTFHVSNSTVFNTSSAVVEYLTFTNNILINTDAGSSDCDYCTFNNNITTESQAFVFGTRSGGNNMTNTNPDLVDISNGSNSPFANDYTPNQSSPAIDAGTDSTDIGITGGNAPFKVYDANMPAIPQVIEMNIYNANIPLNDSLEIQIKGRKQD